MLPHDAHINRPRRCRTSLPPPSFHPTKTNIPLFHSPASSPSETATAKATTGNNSCTAQMSVPSPIPFFFLLFSRELTTFSRTIRVWSRATDAFFIGARRVVMRILMRIARRVRGLVFGKVGRGPAKMVHLSHFTSLISSTKVI